LRILSKVRGGPPPEPPLIQGLSECKFGFRSLLKVYIVSSRERFRKLSNDHQINPILPRGLTTLSYSNCISYVPIIGIIVAKQCVFRGKMGIVGYLLLPELKIFIFYLLNN
jgi:hypothetical protein